MTTTPFLFVPLAQIKTAAYLRVVKYSDDQPRDESGRFAEGGGGSTHQQVRSDDEFSRAYGKAYLDWYNNLSDDEQKAVENYQTDNFAEINAHFRSGEAMSDRAFETTGNLDAALSKAPELLEPLVVYRGMSFKGLAPLAQMKVGDIFTDRGFMSTSPFEDVTEGFIKDSRQFLLNGAKGDDVVLEIRVPSGVRAATIPYNEDFDLPSEVLFPRGSKMKVESIARKGRVVRIGLSYGKY